MDGYVVHPPRGVQAGPAASALAAIVCYNEGANAARTLALVPPAAERDYDVVVVDDGSTDDTWEHIARFAFPVIRHPRNRGLGAAIKSGMRYALEHEYAIFCILAGNAKDDPRQISAVLRPIRAGQADYVQGSRFAAGGSAENTPAGRLVLVKVSRLRGSRAAPDSLTGGPASG